MQQLTRLERTAVGFTSGIDQSGQTMGKRDASGGT